MVTVEGAYAIAAIVGTVVIGVGAVAGASVQIRCTDAAREAARLTAIGDESARATAAALVGAGARITITDSGARIVAEVSAGVPLLPALELSARAVAAKEPDGPVVVEGDGAEAGPADTVIDEPDPEEPP
ncbi:TadE family type IV pilus minor pilin [Gordonia insulae]|uniref:Pilus assembly protein TadE n=1 Tax=Gordonia insulae TaxID=2420509 RepID=A0A3G8JRA0_9ACTN|nr:TadE family type IV pilus minor pilin [Gordonia insulae]AZG47448.1 hypothetical protein D7316_04058 [Gordonia insulae]